jgi:GH18 family chitinase
MHFETDDLKSIFDSLFPQDVAARDQQSAALTDDLKLLSSYVRTLKVFRDSLEDAGFDKGEAFRLTVEAQAALIKTLPDLIRETLNSTGNQGEP